MGVSRRLAGSDSVKLLAPRLADYERTPLVHRRAAAEIGQGKRRLTVAAVQSSPGSRTAPGSD